MSLYVIGKDVNYLLEKIAYASRTAEDYKSPIAQETFKVQNTFPYNPESKTSPKTAKNWAENRGWRNKNKRETEWPTEIRDNTPFVLRVIDLECRSEGGRAYKVVDEESRMFDLREDQFTEALTHGGVQKGGLINGTFIWGQQFSSVRLVYVGGRQYKEMVEGLKERKAREKGGIAKSQLIPGGIYERKVHDIKETVLYLGTLYLKDNPKETFYMLKRVDPGEHWLPDGSRQSTTTWEEEILFPQNTKIDARKSFKPFIKKIGQCSADVLEKARNMHVGFSFIGSYSTPNTQVGNAYDKIDPRPAFNTYTCRSFTEHHKKLRTWQQNCQNWIEKQIVWKN